MSTWVAVGSVADVRRRRKVVVPVGEDESVLVVAHDETFSAFSNVCIHRRKLLERGVLLNGRLVCPGHQWAFDLATGWESKMERCQPMYDVRVAAETVEVDLDSRATRVEEPGPA